MSQQNSTGALAGIKVIDLSRVLGGPYCTQMLADHGAEVIKIEPPQGDETRTWGPPFQGDAASYFIGINRNKRGVALDLSKPEGRDVVLRLLESADVLVENFKTGTLEKWGLGYHEVLAKRFPRLVHCRISGFGGDGPLGGLPGYDAILQAMTGLMSVNGDATTGPLRLGTAIVDMGTGLYSAIGIMMALHECTVSGSGQYLDMTLYDCGMALLHPQAANYFLNDKRPAGTGSYRYARRQAGLSISFERVDNHWRGEKPSFKELEFRLAREESTRLAMLLSGEAQVGDLPRELQKDALKKGMKIFSSSFPVDWMTVYLGGQYYLPGDPAFKADVAWTNKKVRQALNMAINRKELLNAVFAGKGSYTYVTGWSAQSEGYNPEWQSRFDQMYGFNPGKAKALLKEAGYGPGQLKFKILAFTEPGESEGPQVAEALGIYYKDVGIDTEIEVLDWAKVREMFRKKTIQCCIWPNIISWRPSEEWIRTSYYSKSPNHHYENEFVDKTYNALTLAVKPDERQRLARAIGDHLFEEFADIPLFWFANEVVANPKVVGEWVYPGLAAGRSTHFDRIRPPK